MWAGALLMALSLVVADAAAQADGSAQTALPPSVNPSSLEANSGPEQSGLQNASSALLRRAKQNLALLEGRPIHAVSVETVGTRWASKPPIRSIRIGEQLTATVARNALRELLASGGFAQAYADARAFQDGVIVRLVAVPRRIIANLEVESGPLERRRVLAAAQLAEETEITEPMFHAIKARIRKAYRREGYDRATVGIKTSDTDDPMRVVLRLNITAGEVRRVSRRVFVIEPRYDRVVGKLKHGYAVKTGKPISEDKLLDADNEMTELLRSKGFFLTNVKHRVLRRGQHAFLYVYLETGPQFRFFFAGNNKFDDAELRGAFELEAGADPNLTALGERVRRYYQQRGYFDARVRTSERMRQDDAVREISFDIHEGRLLRVTRRLFPCLPVDAPEGLRADDLGKEIDAVLEEQLPSMPLFGAIDEALVDSLISPNRASTRASLRRLSPAVSYDTKAYERALKHLEELLQSKGFLNAKIGPVSLMRAECDPSARAGRCEPLLLPAYPTPQCRLDALALPIGEPPLKSSFSCKPDPKRSISCAPTVALSIPVQLGPQATLYDIVFEGNKTIASTKLLETAAFPLGTPLSRLELEATRNRIHNAYRDLGYAYANVRAELDLSPDRTRARARFIINEHKPVIISGYDVRGALRTDVDLIIGRLALCQQLDRCSGPQKYFKRTLVRESEEQIATLGVFSSVSISLEDPDIPQERKRVIITVVEQRSQYLEPRAGFSTGEGFRLAFEYGHRNVAGRAIALTVRLEFAFLPDFLILDQDVREQYAKFVGQVSERLERRNSASLRLPEIGLGPKVDLVVDGVDVRDNQRDFGLTREALIPTVSYRPGRTLTLQASLSTELNDVTLFEEGGLSGAIKRNPALASLLRVPEGRTIAIAQRASMGWDRRDNAFAATEGTLLTAGVEHVSAFPLDEDTVISSEFLRFTGRSAGYLRLSDRGMALALSLGLGYNLQLKSDSQTYPDRLFYLGGVSSVRGFLLDAMIPEDIAQEVLDGKISIDDVTVRGGNFYINPRAELRIPLISAFSTALFLDAGNLWATTGSIDSMADLFKLRYTAGAGLRAATPIGPIAVDAGVKLVRRDWEDPWAAHFAIGLF